MDDKKTILVVDDEPDLLRLVAYNLGKEGYSVALAGDAEAALKIARTRTIDLAVLDVMLPGASGLELCKMLKAEEATSRIPVIFLTARSQDDDAVEGLNLGADDYISKPFSTKALVARVRAVLRRAAPGAPSSGGGKIAVGDLVIDRETYTASKRGIKLDLSATEFRILLTLATRRGRVFRRDQLLEAVWKDGSYVEPRTIDVHIRRLRMEIEADPAEPEYIKTRRGIGYYMNGPGA